MVASMRSVRFMLCLETLDSETATFTGPDPSFPTLALPRAHWTDLGRPSAVSVSAGPA